MIFTPYKPEIRFADIDAMGHVNNAVYMTYFEQTRIHYFSQMNLGSWDWKKHGVIVARHEIDYIRPLYSGDEVEIYLGFKHIGTKSLTVDYRVVVTAKDGIHKVAAKGATVLVCFDHQTQSTIPVPEEWKNKMSELPSVIS